MKSVEDLDRARRRDLTYLTLTLMTFVLVVVGGLWLILARDLTRECAIRKEYIRTPQDSMRYALNCRREQE